MLKSEYSIQTPFKYGDPVKIEVSGEFTPAKAFELALAIMDSAQKAGATIANPKVED